jgi:hypothetical protein
VVANTTAGRARPTSWPRFPTFTSNANEPSGFRLYEALEQAIADAGEKVPVVAHRQNHKPWVVIARLEDLPRLAMQIYLTMAENA